MSETHNKSKKVSIRKRCTVSITVLSSSTIAAAITVFLPLPTLPAPACNQIQDPGQRLLCNTQLQQRKSIEQLCAKDTRAVVQEWCAKTLKSFDEREKIQSVYNQSKCSRASSPEASLLCEMNENAINQAAKNKSNAEVIGTRPKPTSLGPLKSFVIGMSETEAVQTALKATAPWPVMIKRHSISEQLDSKSISIILQSGPRGASSMESCTSGSIRTPKPSVGETEESLRAQQYNYCLGVADQISLRTTKGLLDTVIFSANYVNSPVGYNLEASGTGYLNFVEILGQKLGVQFKTVQEGNDRIDCSKSVGDIFHPGTTSCESKSAPVSRGANSKMCNCYVRFRASDRGLELLRTTFRDDGKLNF
jgi:hypothetical protein